MGLERLRKLRNTVILLEREKKLGASEIVSARVVETTPRSARLRTQAPALSPGATATRHPTSRPAGVAGDLISAALLESLSQHRGQLDRGLKTGQASPC